MQLKLQGWQCSWNCLQNRSSGTFLWVCEQKRLMIPSMGFLPSVIGGDLTCHYWEMCGLIPLHSGVWRVESYTFVVTFSVLKLDLPTWLRRLNFQIQVSSSVYHASHHFPCPVFDWQLSSESLFSFTVSVIVKTAEWRSHLPNTEELLLYLPLLALPLIC